VSSGAQRGDEVTQFVFNLGRRRHRVRDFLKQQLSVTLSQSMKCLFDGVLGRPNSRAISACDGRSGSSDSNVFNRSSSVMLADP
jgi:hypothetical protein